MFRRSLHSLALKRSFPVLGGGLRSHSNGEADFADEERGDAQAPATQAPSAVGNRIHIVPEVVLRDLTNAISRAQKSFLAGTQSADASDTYSEAFFAIMNTAYEGKFQQQQQAEVETFVGKRRAHYEQRLNEETEEFRRERREVHDELQRIECDKYKQELIKDIAEFAAQRQKDCEARLKKDVDKYHTALRSYRAKQAERAKENAHDPSFDDLEKNLLANINATVDQLEADTQLFDFGPGSKGFGNDLTDEDISGYVEARLRFYERTLQDEIDYYTHRRRAFYEELIQARAIRHAAKIRSDTEKFRAKRSAYYDEKLGSDAMWMAKSFQGHYERCVLSCYARQAWLMHRLAPTSEADPVSDITKMSFDELTQKLPLLKVLDIYASEAVEEISRDVFLKAARRIADGEPSGPTSAPPKGDVRRKQ